MLESAFLSDVGSVRSNNEDFCRTLPELGLFVLADGMGGARGGEFASRLAVDSVVDYIERSTARNAGILLQAVEDANRRVFEEASGNPDLEGMGTTVVAALVVPSMDTSRHEPGEQVAIASVGDSRAYICDRQGFRAITEDQTWVEEVGRPLGLDDQSLKRHPMRHVLTMAIGVALPVTIHYYSVLLAPGSVMLLSTDGLHGVLEAPVIEGILRNADHSLLQKCETLVNRTNAAGGPDNVTVVLIQNPSAACP